MELVESPSQIPAIVPVLPQPRCAMNVREARKEDLAFIDQLQKMHSHMVGFVPSTQIEKHIASGSVLIAEQTENGEQAIGNAPPRKPIPDSPLPIPCPLGYIIFKDQYMKRDDVGIVYQLNVLPLKQRHLVGAMLVKAAFERSAYGCKLFCCWCAQDIQANWFWESIGFLPLAFRTGSRAKQRIHIFWQRRIRAHDEVTPYWFPSQTTGGGVNEDRIVLPIPPGTHWRDAKPLVLPGVPPPQAEQPLTLPGGAPVKPRPEQPKLTRSQQAALARSQSGHLGGAPIGKKAVIRGGRIKYIDIPGFDPSVDGPEELAVPAKAKKPRALRPRMKNDPEYVAAARDLRDRYLEEINSNRLLPGASEGTWGGKYDVSRQLEAGSASRRIEAAGESTQRALAA